MKKGVRAHNLYKQRLLTIKREEEKTGATLQPLKTMKTSLTTQPRPYTTGMHGNLQVKDYGKIYLEAEEQVTFVTPEGKEHDFCAKGWGFYETPSVNKRLRAKGFKTALVHNALGKYFIMIVDEEKIDEFTAYVEKESHVIEAWLDEKKG